MWKTAWFKLILLLQGSPIFTLWAEAKPFTRTLWAWLCLSATAVCLCTLSKGQTKFGRQHSAQQTARSIPPLTAKALPCGTRKIPTRCERRKYKKLVHPMGSKPGNPTAKCSHEVLPGFQALPDKSDCSLWSWMILLAPNSLPLWSKGSAYAHLSSVPVCASSEDSQLKNKPNQSAVECSSCPSAEVSPWIVKWTFGTVACIESFLGASATPLGQTSTCRQAGDDVWRADKIKPPLPPPPWDSTWAAAGHQHWWYTVSAESRQLNQVQETQAKM